MIKAYSEIWRIAVTVPADALETFEALLESYSESVTFFMLDQSDEVNGAEGDWTIEGYSRSLPDKAAFATDLELAAAAHGIPVPAVETALVSETDWVAESLNSFPPILAGRFFIRGSHWEGAVPAGRIGLLIDAATAFGSGEHATTHSCLLALSDLARKLRPHAVLDMGCGTGILAMAAAKLWPIKVMAADIDPEAVRVTRVNVKRNRLGSRIEAQAADGYAHRRIAAGRPYDLIFSNILARPLCKLAPAMSRHLAPGGYVILSGLLGRHEKMVLAAHRLQGLTLVRRVVQGDWHTLVLRKKTR